MKKRFISIVCAAILLIGLFVYWAAGGFMHHAANTNQTESSKTARVAVDPSIAKELIGD